MPDLSDDRKSIYKKQLYINLILIGAFLIIVFILNHAMVSQIHKQGKQATGDALTAILKMNQASMDLWINHISSDIQSWASIGHFQSLVEKHLTHSRDRHSLLTSKTLKDLKDFFAPRLAIHDFHGFFIIAPDFINIGSMRDANIGMSSLIAAQRMDLLKKCFKGETVFIPPIYSDVPLPNKIGKMIPMKSTMFLATPVKNDRGDVIAVMTVRIIPEFNFSRVARIGKLGKTGETYFFDQTGRMLSPSRFEKQLKTIDLIHGEQSSVLNLEIRDPGGDLTAGHIPGLARDDQPLTHMVSMALKNGDGKNISGYRNYLGVRVIGTWLWDDTLGIGMATEMDFSEAAHASEKIHFLLICINSVIVSFGFIIFFAVFKIKSHAVQKIEQALIESKKELELRVSERTFDLQKANKKLSTILEKTSQGFYLVDNQAKIIDINPKMAKLFGRKKNEILGHSFFDFVDDKNKIILINQIRKREKGEDSSYDMALQQPDGTNVTCLFSATRISDEKGNKIGSFAMVTDITERKIFETKLHMAKITAEKANLAKSVFLASMSHELRTPLNSILGFAQLMETKIDKNDDSPHKRYPERIIRSGEHLLKLIDEILELSKIESGAVSVSIESVDVYSAVMEAIEFVRPISMSHGIELLPEKPKKPIFINVDRIKFNQIILNLFSNAVKYNRPNGKVRIFSEISDNKLCLNVVDTGHGIKKDKIKMLFDPFNRLGKETSSVEGTGIGLTITKKLVEMMGGVIGVESEPGIGTLFFVEFTLAEIPIKERKNTVQTSTLERISLTGEYTILYVEDNMINQQLIETILANHSNITLLKANDAARGIEMAMEQKPDLILMDIGLPDMDGFQAFEQLGKIKETRQIPVIGLSANAMPLDIKKAMDIGFADYITKPVNIGKFHRVIANTINAKKITPKFKKRIN